MGSGKLDASGDAGGGTVLVGGAWQGNGPERNASRTIVGSNASIDVSATNNGNGGTSVVWADGRTDMSGTIKATGGINGGNGGNVETSGKAALDLKGRVDISAAAGKGGTGGQWLLDPTDITIVAANANLDGAVMSPNFQDNGGGTTATVNATALGAALTGGATVNVQTSNTGVGGSGVISTEADIIAAGAGTLNLIANGSINVQANISSNGTHALNFGLYAGSTGSPASIATAGMQIGSFQNEGTAITTSGGNVVVVAGTGPVGVSMYGSVTTDGGNITLKSGSTVTLGVALNAGSGTLRIQATDGVSQDTANLRNPPITAANLGVRGSSVNLSGGANTVSGNVGINASAGAVSYKSSRDFVVGSVSADGTLFDATTAGLSAAGNNVTIDSAGAVTQAAGSNVAASTLLLKGAGAFTLTNTTNSVTTIAASTGAGAISFTNAGALTVGNVGTTNGITRTGNVSIKAQTGDLTLANNVTVSNAVVRLQAAAGKVEQTAGVINTSNLSVNAGDGDVAMGTTSNNARFVAIMATGDVVYKSAGTYSVDSIGGDGPIAGVGGISTSGAGKNITLDTAAGRVVADEFSIRTPSGGLLLKGNASYALTASNNVSTIAAETGAGDISFKNTGALVVGNVGTTNGMTRTGDVALQTGGALTQTQAIVAANLNLTGGQSVVLSSAGNNIASLSGNTAALSLTNSGALALGALTVTSGTLNLTTGGTLSQTGALTQSGATPGIILNATTGNIKLTNAANDVSGMAIMTASAGGVAFTNNNAAGIKVGVITAATSMNTTNPADIANFTASDAALTGVVLLQARQGNIQSALLRGTPKIVADRTVLVAANRIGGATATDTTLGVRVEGAAGASAREVYVSAGATQMASVFGPTAVPTFYKSLMNGATALPSPASLAYNGVVLNLDPAPAAATAATTAAGPAPVNVNDAARRAQTIAQNQAPRLSRSEARLNPVVTQRTEQANTQFGNDRRNDTRVEPITIPSCAPGAARPAAAGQCL